MTKKRFELRLCSNGSYYLYHKGILINNPYVTFDKFNKEDAESIVGELNHLAEENEQLKQFFKELKGSGYWNEDYLTVQDWTDVKQWIERVIKKGDV